MVVVMMMVMVMVILMVEVIRMAIVTVSRVFETAMAAPGTGENTLLNLMQVDCYNEDCSGPLIL